MICTFYSYKGGVGRSMALANVADVLARRGRRILMIDFDLEAPGLEQYFPINLEGVRRHTGLLDLLLGYKQAMSVARTADAPFRHVDNFICPVYERLPGGGRLDLMPAGQRQDREQLARYALNLRSFDWQDFYFNWQGELFFEWLRCELTAPRGDAAARYDLVLVDSRTGVTEMGGICGYQLADLIVMMCAANHQNVQGTANMLRDFRSPNVEALRGGRPLQIMIVPARVEQRDPKLLEAFHARFHEAFAGHVPPALKEAGIGFTDLTIPYEPHFAFEEQVVSDPAQANGRRQIGSAFIKLADCVQLLAPPVVSGATAAAPAEPDAKATESVEANAPAAPARSAPGPEVPVAAGPAEAQYDAARRFAGYDVYLDFGQQDREPALALAQHLKAHGLQVFVDAYDHKPGADWQAVTEEALFHSRFLVLCVGAGEFGEWRRQILGQALKARERGREFHLLPVILPGGEPAQLRGTPAEAVIAVDLRGGVNESAVQPLLAAITGRSREGTRVESEARMPYPERFEEQHADLFFGREQVVADLEAQLERGRVAVLTGPSGSGRASVVRAGLLPRWRKRLAGQCSIFVELRPGEDTWNQLRSGLLTAEPTRTELQTPQTPAALLRAATVTEGGAPRAVMVFLDHFEEAFEDAGGRPRQREFLDDLVSLVAGPLPAGMFVVVSLRGDAIEQLKPYPALAQLAQACQVPLPPIGREELRRMIQGPAEVVGLAFEPGLVERIVTDFDGYPGALPLLHGMLVKLWEARRAGWMTNAAYDALGGLRGDLEQLGERVYASLKSSEQEALRWIMLRLVQVGDQLTRRRVFANELLPVEVQQHQDQIAPYWNALRALRNARLVLVSEDSGRQTIELSHDLLLRGWPRLAQWIEEGRQFQVWRQSIEASRRQWEEGGRKSAGLLRGNLLMDALRWTLEAKSQLTGAELEYIRRSRNSTYLRAAAGVAVFASFVIGLILLIKVFRHAESTQAESDRAQRVGILATWAGDMAANGEWEGAISNYTAAIELATNRTDLFLLRGQAWLASGQPARATNDFAQVLSRESGTDLLVPAHLAQGQAFLSLNLAASALAEFAAATQLAPTNATVWFARGNAQAQLGRPQEAVASYNRALLADTNYAEARLNRALALTQSGLSNSAIQDFKAVLALTNAETRLKEVATVRLTELGEKSATAVTNPQTRIRFEFAAADASTVREVISRLPRDRFLGTGSPGDRPAQIPSVNYSYPRDEAAANETKYLLESEFARRGIPLRLQVNYVDAKTVKDARPGSLVVNLPSLAESAFKYNAPVQGIKPPGNLRTQSKY